jgi:hypothetical protein
MGGSEPLKSGGGVRVEGLFADSRACGGRPIEGGSNFVSADARDIHETAAAPASGTPRAPTGLPRHAGG